MNQMTHGNWQVILYITKNLGKHLVSWYYFICSIIPLLKLYIMVGFLGWCQRIP